MFNLLKKNKQIYDLVPSSDDDSKFVLNTNKNSKLPGIKFKLNNISLDAETGELIIDYDVLECPEKYDLKGKDDAEFTKILEEIFNQMIQDSIKEMKKKEEQDEKGK